MLFPIVIHLIIKAMPDSREFICRSEDGGNPVRKKRFELLTFSQTYATAFSCLAIESQSCAFITTACVLMFPPVVCYIFKNGFLLVNVVLEEC